MTAPAPSIPPLPWRQTQGSRTYGDTIIVAADGSEVVDCSSWDRTTFGSIALAGAIVRRVNAFDALLAELRRLEWSDQGYLGDRVTRWCPSCGGPESAHAPDCTLAAALALADDEPA